MFSHLSTDDDDVYSSHQHRFITVTLRRAHWAHSAVLTLVSLVSSGPAWRLLWCTTDRRRKRRAAGNSDTWQIHKSGCLCWPRSGPRLSIWTPVPSGWSPQSSARSAALWSERPPASARADRRLSLRNNRTWRRERCNSWTWTSSLRPHGLCMSTRCREELWCDDTSAKKSNAAYEERWTQCHLQKDKAHHHACVCVCSSLRSMTSVILNVFWW